MIKQMEISQTSMNDLNSLFSLQLLNQVYNMQSEQGSSTAENNTPMDIYQENLQISNAQELQSQAFKKQQQIPNIMVDNVAIAQSKFLMKQSNMETEKRAIRRGDKKYEQFSGEKVEDLNEKLKKDFQILQSKVEGMIQDFEKDICPSKLSQTARSYCSREKSKEMSIKKVIEMNFETNQKPVQTEPDLFSSSKKKEMYSSRKKLISESSDSKESSAIKYKNSLKKENSDLGRTLLVKMKSINLLKASNNPISSCSSSRIKSGKKSKGLSLVSPQKISTKEKSSKILLTHAQTNREKRNINMKENVQVYKGGKKPMVNPSNFFSQRRVTNRLL